MTKSTDMAGKTDEPKPGQIELTSIVDGSVAGDFKDDIIELTNIVDDDASLDELTTIIDLTDIVDGNSSLDAMTDVIDLDDIADGDTSKSAKESLEKDGEEVFVEVDEDYIEVTDEPFDAGDTGEDDEFDMEFDEDDNEKKPMSGLSKSAATAFDMEKVKELVRQEIGNQLAENEQDVDDDENNNIEVDIPPEEIKIAIEKIIQEKFSENIESVFFEVMEKVMEKEIAAVKKNMQKDLDNIMKS
jgi:hypothetical protein